MVLEKTLESLLDCKEIQPVHPKGNHPEYSLEGLMLKLQYLGHLIQRADSLEKTPMLGNIENRRTSVSYPPGWSLSQSLYMRSGSIVPALDLVPSLQWLSRSDRILPSEKSKV